ncbi:MAG: histidine phosphatase family protein [Sphingosinicella sp.]|nr:histidine phosphatase family protein [Sphingosinicella sp.]
MTLMTTPTLYLARHAETVFNAAARMQGHMGHTPLTRNGIRQADDMGRALRASLGPKPDIDLWASRSGRTMQTAAIIAEHLERDFFDIRADDRLLEIDVGDWEGRLYHDIVAESGPVMCPDRRIFLRQPPNGEWYPDIERRLQNWLADLDSARPALVISHGITARVLRGALVGGTPFEPGCVPLAKDAPQGTVFRIEGGREEPIHVGHGSVDGKAKGF